MIYFFRTLLVEGLECGVVNENHSVPLVFFFTFETGMAEDFS